MAADSSLFRVGGYVEWWRVLQYLCILLCAIFAFEVVLHRFERVVSKSRKYQRMVSKVYRELMVLGLVGLALKLIKESPLSVSSSAMLSLQVADLMIFILAFALIIQATCVFLRQRKYNHQVERAELISTTDFVEWSEAAIESKKNGPCCHFGSSSKGYRTTRRL